MYALAAVMFLLIASPFASVVAYSVPTGNGSHGNNSANPLSLTIDTGVIAAAGDQTWKQSGGVLVDAMVEGSPIGPGGHINYHLQASVEGMSASGTFSMQLTDTQNGVSMMANGVVVAYDPSVCFPSYQCLSTDTSGIPAFFVVLITSGSVTDGSSSMSLVGSTFSVESGIMNPFGGPIVIASIDGSIVIVATYRQSSVDWQGVQLEGTVSGTLGSTPVVGGFTQTVNAHENLVTGTESETGIIAMSVGSLNVQGHFSGSSTTPASDPTNFDCSSTLGLPDGTCLATALVSTGSFTMHGQGTTVSGTYDIYWPAPSVVFGGTITATVQQAGQGN